ncbi:MAG TPA: serine/threonine-protein kinase, partial [Verrucomicrobiae bacterium]|nr:serine/threonine-protein kinase [Verrucomicrobiae bacterium]
IGATAFLNLVRQDGFRQVSLTRQRAAVAVAGFVLGILMCLLRPWPAAGAAAGAAIACFWVALYLGSRHFWFAWPIIVFAQLPLALTWSIGGRFIRLKFEKDVLTRTLEETTRLVEATKLTAHKSAQLVPDHDLVRLVGKGAYGEVWLARNAVGVFHAVKIVRRAAFPSDVPYDREFRGIQKFMPVSRSHPGFVHLLHVGRNETERCFYCIMEVGDDQTSGQRIDPETYTPKSLASELKWRGRLAPEESLRIGLALSLALEHLHQHGLIHRDIKPGNIIYVDNQPKFADIGLVTDIAGEGRDVSFLGTQGYIPPEGPGSPAADVYALGKVLYEAAMGRDREFFPELPTAVFEASDDSLLRKLQKVIFKACEAETIDRYRSAAELHTALLEMHRSWKQREGETRSD